jgi:hypothetical protein
MRLYRERSNVGLPFFIGTLITLGDASGWYSPNHRYLNSQIYKEPKFTATSNTNAKQQVNPEGC